MSEKKQSGDQPFERVRTRALDYGKSTQTVLDKKHQVIHLERDEIELDQDVGPSSASASSATMDINNSGRNINSSSNNNPSAAANGDTSTTSSIAADRPRRLRRSGSNTYNLPQQIWDLSPDRDRDRDKHNVSMKEDRLAHPLTPPSSSSTASNSTAYAASARRRDMDVTPSETDERFVIVLQRQKAVSSNSVGASRASTRLGSAVTSTNAPHYIVKSTTHPQFRSIDNSQQHNNTNSSTSTSNNSPVTHYHPLLPTNASPPSMSDFSIYRSTPVNTTSSASLPLAHKMAPSSNQPIATDANGQPIPVKRPVGRPPKIRNITEVDKPTNNSQTNTNPATPTPVTTVATPTKINTTTAVATPSASSSSSSSSSTNQPTMTTRISTRNSTLASSTFAATQSMSPAPSSPPSHTLRSPRITRRWSMTPATPGSQPQQPLDGPPVYTSFPESPKSVSSVSSASDNESDEEMTDADNDDEDKTDIQMKAAGDEEKQRSTDTTDSDTDADAVAVELTGHELELAQIQRGTHPLYTAALKKLQEATAEKHKAAARQREERLRHVEELYAAELKEAADELKHDTETLTDRLTQELLLQYRITHDTVAFNTRKRPALIHSANIRALKKSFLTHYTLNSEDAINDIAKIRNEMKVLYGGRENRYERHEKRMLAMLPRGADRSIWRPPHQTVGLSLLGKRKRGEGSSKGTGTGTAAGKKEETTFHTRSRTRSGQT